LKRVALLVALLALPAFGAAVSWYDNYNRGVEAVRNKQYAAGADLLQRAIGEMPTESGSVRYRSEPFITYMPHFWLGIAKFNLGDYDGALREFKTSQDQGAIQNTQYLPQLNDWVSKSNSARQRNAENAAAASKREANAAIMRAAIAQSSAVSAGADRIEAYRVADRKLREAMAAAGNSGTDINAYKRVADMATQAEGLFKGAAEEAKKLKAARPPAVAAKPQPQPAQPQPRPAEVIAAQQPPVVVTKTEPPPKPVATATQAPPQTQPASESEALVNARVAVQSYKRHLIDAHQPANDAQKFERELSGDPKVIARVTSQVAEKEKQLAAKMAKAAKPVEVVENRDAGIRAQLESAFRLFASGDLQSSEQQLSSVLGSQRSAEAFLLRGCARYTSAMLGRNRDAMLASAAADFREALKLNSALRLDRSSFSPKLVAYFDGLRAGAR
jgi:hypothetical protein